MLTPPADKRRTPVPFPRDSLGNHTEVAQDKTEANQPDQSNTKDTLFREDVALSDEAILRITEKLSRDMLNQSVTAAKTAGILT